MLIAGAAPGSALFSRTLPRPSGLRCTGLSVKPGKGWGIIPVLVLVATVQAFMLICRSGRPRSELLLTNAPAYTPLVESTPFLKKTYCAPALSLRAQLEATSFSVIGLGQRNINCI